MYITGKKLSRRTMLRGMGTAAIALPFLDSMVPAFAAPTRSFDWPAPARVIAAIQTSVATRVASSATRPTWRSVAAPAEPARILAPCLA